MNDVVRATVKEHNKTPGKMEWRVLIVDDQSMRMVSACTKMHELSTEGITSNREALRFDNATPLLRHTILLQLWKLLRRGVNLYLQWRLFTW